jgi:hypothetical protein
MIRTAGIAAMFIFASSALAAPTVSTVKILKDEYGRLTVISRAENTLENVPVKAFTSKEYPQYIVEHQPIQAGRIIELQGTDKSAINQWLKDHHVAPMPAALEDGPKDEVRTIVNSGPAANRIDLVFMGDGYTAGEREKFFADISRLVNDMFIGKTFTSYLPVFNVHAVFRASNKSGIGRGSAIDTAYGLYREGETLRAIFPSRQFAIRESCRQAPGCDYPVVIANDPYYGGLGGEFAISTSSPTSGTVVLRHELGHNFGRVGEEYDGGGYFGANYSSNFREPSWSHWATDRGALRAEPMVARYLGWPWHKLDKGPFSINMSSDGKYNRTWMRLSASGIETPDTLSIKMDGQDVAFESPNRLDRSFINVELPGLQSGKHTVTFKENVQDHNNWVSSLTVHEYADDFHESMDFIGAFPNFDEDLSVAGYRPTNESCLMRDMTHEFFCPVCQENNWAHFFDKISLIDSATATVSGQSITAEVKTLSLGQFRSGGTGAIGEKMEIIWTADGQELTQFRDQPKIIFESPSKPKSLSVDVRFLTTEIRTEAVSAHKSIPMQF